LLLVGLSGGLHPQPREEVWCGNHVGFVTDAKAQSRLLWL